MLVMCGDFISSLLDVSASMRLKIVLVLSGDFIFSLFDE